MARTVEELYDIYLNRAPDPGGLSFWEEAIKGGPTSGIDPEEIQAFIAAARSAGETVRRPTTGRKTAEQQVTDLYYQYLNREPDAAGLAFWSNKIKEGPTRGLDPEEITAFLAGATANQETPAYSANVTTRPTVVQGEEGMFSFSQAPAYQAVARAGDKTFEGKPYFEADKQNILKQLKAQQEAGMKYTASFTSDQGKILDDLATRLAAQGVTDITDLKPIMSGETMRDTGEGQIERVESTQIGLYNAKTGEQLDLKMLTNSSGKGTTNYRATFVNGIPVFTATQAATGLEQIQQDFGPILAIAASALLPGLPVGNMTLGQFLGTSLGLSGSAATAVGNALVAGGGTFAATGSAEKAALAALMVGGGGFIKDTGVLGDVMDRVGLGDYRQTFGVLNSAQAGDLNFVAADATQLASQGLGVNGIQQNLIAAGVDPTIAASAANLAVTGATTGQIVTDLKNFTGGNNVFTGVDTGAATGITATTGAGQTGLTGTTTTTTGGGGTGLVTGTTTTTGTGGALGSGLTTGTGGATLGGGTTTTTGTTLGSGLTTGGTGAVIGGGTGLVTGTTLGTGLTGAVSNVAGGLLGSLLNQVPNVVGTGINYAVQQRQIEQLLGVGNAAAARLNELAAKSQLTPAEYQELSNLAQQVKTETAAAGQASQVPFTPYTMTTGFGTTGVTPTGATATAAPEYEAIRRQSLGLAGQTLGAINPAQAAQTLYGQVEALAAPGRERDQLALQNRLARQGLLGFGTTLPTTGGGARTVNPLFESLLSAQETARAQQALQAQQFGTSEATRQAALAQGLLDQAQGIDQQTLAQLQTTGQLGINLNQLEQANRARALQAQLAGISAPLTTGISAAQLRQADLQRQAQLGAQAAQAQTQAAIAALAPQQQQTQAVGNLATGLLNPIVTAVMKEILG